MDASTNMRHENPEPFVFVIMPFSAEFKDVYDLGIKAACQNVGARCERVDEQIFSENILDRIYNQIVKANIVVAEMSERNPNVFYEAGYAHGLGKNVILLTKSANDIPFDLKHYPHIIYSSIVTLKEQLEQKIHWFIENPQENIGRKAGDWQRISQHIINYLNAHNYRMVSFERIRENINAGYSDEVLLALIDKTPETFRRVRLAENKPGIGLV
jgi:hypothetical protein